MCEVVFLYANNSNKQNLNYALILVYFQSIFDPMNFESIISEEIKYRHKKLRMHSSSVQHMFSKFYKYKDDNIHKSEALKR